MYALKRVAAIWLKAAQKTCEFHSGALLLKFNRKQRVKPVIYK